MISSVHTWQHCTTLSNIYKHAHKTQTPLLVFPLCSPWDHLTLNSRHSLQRKHSRQQLNTQTNKCKPSHGEGTFWEDLCSKEKRRSPGRGDVSQWVKVSADRVQGVAVRARDSGILGDIISRDANTSQVKITAQLALLLVTLTPN